ncbi:hypothetical protein KPP03845_106032 [Streptomyces xanthophaeus]|uniref:hypothetical protein n=1 Tax=Streptomyces xanthophaeus TaxID=67385 RepID=UPI00233F4D4D|nr:hypothetical protein [Streptomyces xanthophaeus]WCD89611.1 hypothetical protein KPP03845_106032 [Streptomyces xanthophaeus]
MFGMKSSPQSSSSSDLTSSQAVAASQEVYDRIVSGKCTDARAELDAVHGREPDQKAS